MSPECLSSSPSSGRLRIFYAGPNAPTPGISSKLWRINLHDSLVEMGHEVIEFSYDVSCAFAHIDAKSEANRAFIAENRPKLSAELIRQIKQAHRTSPINVLFTYFADALVLVETLEEIRAMEIITLNWYCNASYQFGLVREIAPHFDWCLVPERNRLSYYEGVGARPIYCPEAANSNYYRPTDVAKDIPVSFVGQAYGERPGLVCKLLDAGVPVKVFGPRWPDYFRLKRFFGLFEQTSGHLQVPRRIYGGIPDEQLVAIFNRTQVNLGFSAVWNDGQRELQVRLRDFEIPMCGAFLLTEYQPELEEYFDIGKEIDCYRDPDDLVEKVKYYLARPRRCKEIGHAARERCLRDHTWVKRFEAIFAKIGIAHARTSSHM
jgi:spore maturation protein CgeB